MCFLRDLQFLQCAMVQPLEVRQVICPCLCLRRISIWIYLSLNFFTSRCHSQLMFVVWVLPNGLEILYSAYVYPLAACWAIYADLCQRIYTVQLYFSFHLFYSRFQSHYMLQCGCFLWALRFYNVPIPSRLQFVWCSALASARELTTILMYIFFHFISLLVSILNICYCVSSLHNGLAILNVHLSSCLQYAWYSAFASACIFITVQIFLSFHFFSFSDPLTIIIGCVLPYGLAISQGAIYYPIMVRLTLGSCRCLQWWYGLDSFFPSLYLPGDYHVYCYCQCASPGLANFAQCNYLAAMGMVVALLLSLLVFSYVTLFICYVVSSHTCSVQFHCFALSFGRVLPAPLLYYCMGHMTGNSPSCLYFRCPLHFSQRSSLLLWVTDLCFSLTGSQAMLCGIFTLFIILVQIVLIFVPTCLCVTLHLTRLWMCHCSFGPFLSRSAVAGSDRSRSALGLAGIVASPPPLLPF